MIITKTSKQHTSISYYPARPTQQCSLMPQNETQKTKSGTNLASSLDNSPYLPARSKLYFNSFTLNLYNPSKNPVIKPPTKHKRGDIKEFSRKSRRRMLLKLSRFNYDSYFTKLFFTTTFHNIYPKSKKDTKDYLLRIIKRIERIDPAFTIIWRVEIQKRGAPHFHFILLLDKALNGKDKLLYCKKLKNAWGDITSDINKFSYSVGSDVRELNSNHKTFMYIAKYSAKYIDGSKVLKLGRFWGVRGNIITFNNIEIDCSPHFIETLRTMILNEMQTKITLNQKYVNYVMTFDLVKFIIPYEIILILLKATSDLTGEVINLDQLYSQEELFNNLE